MTSRLGTRKSSAADHDIWAHSASSMSNPTLSRSRYPLGYGRPQQQRHHSDRFAVPRRPLDYPNYPSASGSASTDSPGTPSAAQKVLSSVKRSFSSKKPGPSASLTISTAEETAARIRISDGTSFTPPPTVQQIAAGLVTGLRPRPPYRQSTTPTPTRSSLKKSPISNTSSSSSTSLASTSLMSTTTAATSVASSHRRFRFKDALFRRSASVSPTPVRKAVRFDSPGVEPTPLPS